ncbi:MAG: CPBP family intramembrane metalloprotease [Planctomycetes bacterium]|nr:CPBP family intramembrane metalloprotease [Planctomycetota bacterium]
MMNEGKRAAGPSRHLNFEEGSYFESTSRPLYALAFLLPLVVVYEIGTFRLNTDMIALTQSRVATFTWLMGLAEWIGMDRSLAWAFPGLVAVIILFCWHMSSHHPWRIRVGWIGGMAVESMVLTLPLFLIGSLTSSSLNISVMAEGDPVQSQRYLADITTAIGAGIYEELVFRLILLGLLVMVMEDALKLKKSTSMVLTVALSALLFAGHHYVGLGGEGFYWIEEFAAGGFVFRTMAGVYFAVLLRWRGFGIIAGTHAAFDIIMFTMEMWG